MKNTQKCDVLILIEHVARELESAMLIKYFLQKKGYDVIVDSIKFHKEAVVLKYSPNIVIVPWAYTNTEMNLFRSFLKNNKKVLILNMHHEQLSNEGSDSFIIPQEDAKEVLHLSWGLDFSNKLLENGCKKETIIQCGNPRLDFYKKDLVKISETKESLAKKYNLDKSKRWVVFIANSFHLLTPAQIKVNLDKGVDIKEQIETSKISRNDFLQYADRYLAENDDVEIIYRPHPSFAHLEKERKEIKELEEKYKNFNCISKNSIRDWIINCDLSISFHSTSIIESCIANKEFYLIRTKKLNKDKDYKFFRDYEFCIKDYSDFYKAIKKDQEFNYDKFIKDTKSSIDLNLDRYSAKVLVDQIDEIYRNNDKNYTDIEFNKKDHMNNVRYKVIKKVIYKLSKFKFVKNYMTSKNDIRLFNLLYEGDDYFTKDDLNRLENKIEDILG